MLRLVSPRGGCKDRTREEVASFAGDPRKLLGLAGPFDSTLKAGLLKRLRDTCSICYAKVSRGRARCELDATQGEILDQAAG